MPVIGSSLMKHCRGLLTLLIGLATFVMMPASPTQTKNFFWPNGWFTEREEVIMVNRILRDDPTKVSVKKSVLFKSYSELYIWKGDMHNRQGIGFKRLLRVLVDFDLYPLYAIGFLFCIPITPPGFYLSLNLRSIGYASSFVFWVCNITAQYWPCYYAGLILHKPIFSSFPSRLVD